MDRFFVILIVMQLGILSACAKVASDEPRNEEVSQEPTVEVSRASVVESGDYSETDFECLREAIYFEAGAQSPAGQKAVANVIMNRAKDPRFPNSICGVIREGETRGICQFEYRCDGRSETFADTVKLRSSTKAARAALESPHVDVTQGATFFHAKWMRPGWFASLDRTVTLGGNIFYRG